MTLLDDFQRHVELLIAGWLEILMETHPRYRFDVFLSYSRAQSWPAFVNRHFRPIIDHWLCAELGVDVDMFHDDRAIQIGQQWPREINRGLRESRVMVALLSRNYFQSEWCRRELAAVLARAEWLREVGRDDRLVFPVAVHDCDLDDLPEVVKPLQILRIHPYADPFMHPQSQRREQLSRKLQPLCGQIARRLKEFRDENVVWPPPDDSKYRDLLMPASRAKGSAPSLRHDP